MANRTSSNTHKVVKYRRPININIGYLAFGAIFVYIVVLIFLANQSHSIAGYEVKTGSLAISNTYRAFAVRTEEVIPSSFSGYPNFYVHDGDRINVGGLVYSIDETNMLADFLNDPANAVSISAEEREEFCEQLRLYRKQTPQNDSSGIHALASDLAVTLKKFDNYSIFEYVDQLKELKKTAGFHMLYSQNSGVVSYMVDGYESMTVDEITASTFQENNYEKSYTMNHQILTVGDPAYKIATNEVWQLVIPLTPEQVTSLIDKSTVKVTFLRNQISSYADFTIQQKADVALGILTLYDSMAEFVSERYIPIEISTTEETGLKIPVTSIVEKQFLMIPIEYVFKSGKSTKEGVSLVTYNEKGEQTYSFVEVNIYAATEEEYYISDEKLHPGDIIRMGDSAQTYTINKFGSLIGVYNINKGYADFRQISILYQNNEYAIVKSNTPYGLMAYDYIVLDASSVDEDDFIY